MKIIIHNKEYNSLHELLIWYGYTHNEYRNEVANGGNIYSLLKISGLVEEDLTEEDLVYIDSLVRDKYKVTNVYKEIPDNVRQKINRRVRKGWATYTISADLGLEYGLVKEYLALKNTVEVIDGQKQCILCKETKDTSKFWKSKGSLSSKCADCLNKERRDRRANDPEYRKAIAKSKKKAYEKGKTLEVNKSSYAYRTRTEEKMNHMKEKRKVNYHKNMQKRYSKQMTKIRLLTKNILGTE